MIILDHTIYRQFYTNRKFIATGQSFHDWRSQTESFLR